MDASHAAMRRAVDGLNGVSIEGAASGCNRDWKGCAGPRTLETPACAGHALKGFHERIPQTYVFSVAPL